MIIVSYAVGLGIEFVFAIWRGHEVNEGYLVTGLLIPMIMPIDLPLWMLAISVIFSVVIGKEAFGGTGMNIFNPALLARAFAFFGYPLYMSGDKIWVSDASTIDAVSGETILGALASGKEVAYSSMDMFLGFIPGSIAETSTLAVLIGAVILIATGIGSWKIMLSGLIGAALTALMFNAVGITPLMNFEWMESFNCRWIRFRTCVYGNRPSFCSTNRYRKINLWILNRILRNYNSNLQSSLSRRNYVVHIINERISTNY